MSLLFVSLYFLAPIVAIIFCLWVTIIFIFVGMMFLWLTIVVGIIWAHILSGISVSFVLTVRLGIIIVLVAQNSPHVWLQYTGNVEYLRPELFVVKFFLYHKYVLCIYIWRNCVFFFKGPAPWFPRPFPLFWMFNYCYHYFVQLHFLLNF